MDAWPDLQIAPASTKKLREHYSLEKQQLQITLGLFYPPFTPDEAQAAWPEYLRLEMLFNEIDRWRAANFVLDGFLPAKYARLLELRQRLEGHTRPAAPQSDAERLETVNFLLKGIQELRLLGELKQLENERKLSYPLLVEKGKLEALLKPEPAPVAQTIAQPQLVPAIDSPQPAPVSPPVPPAPHMPLRETIWRSILSERTLHALLFLGIFLLFTAAISFVIWGWKDFSAPIRVAIPSGFTVTFFFLGWLVRTKTSMRRSGIALSAIAALFVPIDCYTVYANYGSPPQGWPDFWLWTSLACLTAYTLSALSIQSRFFGYITAVAIGSTFLAVLEKFFQPLGLSRDWYFAAPTVLAAAFDLTALALERRKDAARWNFFAEPFRFLALILPAALMPLTLALRLITRESYDALHYAMSVNWLLGGLLFGWGAVRHHSRGLGNLAALSLPVAVYMLQSALFFETHTNPAWHAFGLACLTPIYLLTGYKLQQAAKQLAPSDSQLPNLPESQSTNLPTPNLPIYHHHSQTALRWGVALIVVAALLPLTNLSSGAAAAASHAVLLVSVALAAWLWKQPRYVYAASFFAFTAASFAMSELKLPLEQLSLGWVSLSLAHIFLALGLGNQTSFSSPQPLSPRERGLVPSPLGGGRRVRAIFAPPLVISAYLIAGLAVLSPVFFDKRYLLVYTLGNWLVLSAWGALLAWRKQPGFCIPETQPVSPESTFDSNAPHSALPHTSPAPRTSHALIPHALSTGAIFHWMAALPLPYWLFVVFTREQPVGVDFALALAALAWGMVFVNHWLRFTPGECRLPWRLTGLFVSVCAPIAAGVLDTGGYVIAISLLSAGLLYFADTLASRQRWEFYPAALVTAWGLAYWLNTARVETEFLALSLCGLASVYFLAGLLAERYRWQKSAFLAPLYHSAHLLSAWVLLYIYLNWLISFPNTTDRYQLVTGLAQLLLAFSYTLFAWGRYQKIWAFLAVWLAAGGGGFIVMVYSHGEGSLAAKGALIVTALVLAERLLNFLARSNHHRDTENTEILKGFSPRSLWLSGEVASRPRATIRLAWALFSQPLLFTGWAGSAAVIGLALIRNLVWLGGGRIQQIWAAVGLLIITALYALSARLFRQARFAWLAGGLVFIPWTILTNLGWFTAWKPDLPDFAVSWMVLAWGLLGLNLLLLHLHPDSGASHQPDGEKPLNDSIFGLNIPHLTWCDAPSVSLRSYATPFSVYAHLLTPFALLWSVADAGASRFSVGLAILLYGFCAWLQHRRTVRDETVPALTATRFLYPAISLVPLWCVYLLKWSLPPARHEHFGLLLLTFGIWGLLAGRWLEKIAPRPHLKRIYSLPAHLTAYAALIVGTLLTAHLPVLLALALLYAALLLVVSARIFRSALWIYPATGLTTLAWLIALAQAGVPLERRGWWLLGLAVLYLALGWALRRARLPAYGAATLAAGFTVSALSLPPSSLDNTGALWGYGGAALLYAICAFWLNQPLLLVLTCALAPVTYASALQLSSIQPAYYGLMLFPGVILAFGLGWWADLRLGAWRAFPFGSPLKWPLAFAERLTHWWGLPLYALGLGLASFAPAFTSHHADLTALNFFLLLFFYAAAAYRFRSRFWLGMATLAGHLAAIFYIEFRSWWSYPDYGWLRFLPVTLLTAALALGLERWLKEGSPFESGKRFKGWSRPLYWFVFVDILLGQWGSLRESFAGTIVSLVHALLIALLASIWMSKWLPYLSAFLGLVALFQWQQAANLPDSRLSVHLAGLALGYGALGFGYSLLKRQERLNSSILNQPWAGWMGIWEPPLQRAGMTISILAFLANFLQGFKLFITSLLIVFGLSSRAEVPLEMAWMAVDVFSLIGLLYAAAAAGYKRLRLGYLAVGLLLAGWFMFAFYINTWDGLRQMQWYALPAGLYLLTIAYLEWRNGQKTLGRWLDYLAMLLMLGSLFWQTLVFGLLFAFLLICEGMVALWWGSARRLRRFFYAGIIGVLLAVLGQLLNALQTVNQWLVFGLIGLLLVALAILVERKLDAIKAWQKVLETWE